MTAPLQYGTQPAPDPTAVMGRRTLAWIADLLLYAGVVALGFASMAEYTEIPPGIADEDACQLLEAQTGTLEGGCIAMDGTVYLLDTGEAGVQTLLSLGWLAFFVVLQGLTGGSPGKLLFGLRVVDQHGERCGVGKSLGRTLMWAIDAAPWIIPLVGPITAFTSSGHRRVGDLAAGTYVVSSSSVGSPVVASAAAAPAGQQPWGAAPPGWGAPPTAPPSAPAPGSMLAPPTTPEPAADARWPSPSATPPPDLDIRDLHVPDATEAVDEAPPTVEADPDWSRLPEAASEPPAAPTWEPPTLPEVEEPSTSWTPPDGPFVAPGAEAPARPSTPAQPPEELPPPQWDPARGTYLQWQPSQQAWLQWDTARQRWKPIDS